MTMDNLRSIERQIERRRRRNQLARQSRRQNRQAMQLKREKRRRRRNQHAAPAAPVRAASATYEYYLIDEAGQWLHESLEALTKNKRFAWKGTTKKIEVVLKRMPKWKVLVPERVG